MNVRVVMYRVQYQPERQDRADDATARESARTLEKINSAAKRFFFATELGVCNEPEILCLTCDTPRRCGEKKKAAKARKYQTWAT